MKVLVDYPSFEEEKNILENHSSLNSEKIKSVVTPEEIISKKEIIESIYINDRLMEYIVSVVCETRKKPADESSRLIEFGASPRASIALMKASRCLAFMKGRGFVTPDDIKEIAPDVLRHRIILSYQAEAEGKSPDDIVKMVLDSVEVP